MIRVLTNRVDLLNEHIKINEKSIKTNQEALDVLNGIYFNYSSDIAIGRNILESTRSIKKDIQESKDFIARKTKERTEIQTEITRLKKGK